MDYFKNIFIYLQLLWSNNKSIYTVKINNLIILKRKKRGFMAKKTAKDIAKEKTAELEKEILNSDSDKTAKNPVLDSALSRSAKIFDNIKKKEF